MDKWTKFMLFWIAFMLTIIAFRPIFEIQPVQAESKDEKKFPAKVKVELREPIAIKIVDIRSTWPYEVKIRDKVEVKGELKLRD